MRQLVFATNNANKLREVRELTGNSYEILSLQDIGCHEELPETHETLEENAIEKAQYVFDNYHISCFAEDTGLEIEALDGEPGVYSARYAGTSRSAEANMKLVLQKMRLITDRRACFKTVIAHIAPSGIHTFEGTANGEILYEPRGEGGFGYDPIFQPKGYDVSFAEMDAQEKNNISHRSSALKKLLSYLNQQKNT